MTEGPRFIQFVVISEVEGNVNADESVGTRITIKKFITKDGIYPYISSRALKKGLKNALQREGYKIDPYEKSYSQLGASQKGDSGNVVDYIDQDIFGYLIPSGTPRKRKSPVEISYLTSVFPIPISVEFAGRFPKNDNPIPFEIEQAKFIGRFYGIIYNYIGIFSEDELVDDNIKSRLIKKEGYYETPDRKERIKAILNILLTGTYILPRSSDQLNYGNYKYVILVLTKTIKPLPSFVSIKHEKEKEYEVVKRQDGDKVIEKVIERSTEGYKLDIDKLKEINKLLEDGEELYIIDFVGDLENVEDFNIVKPSKIKLLIDDIVENKLDLENIKYYLGYYE